MCNRLLTLFLFVSFFGVSQKNTRIGVFGGAGIPDMIHVGGKYQVNQFEVGVHAGTFPWVLSEPERNLYNISGHFIWHFGGKSKHLISRPWYLKTDLTYYFEENEKFIWHIFASGLRIGREFAFNDKMSIQLDLGVGYYLYERQIAKHPSNSYGWDISPNLPFLPAASVTFFTGW